MKLGMYSATHENVITVPLSRDRNNSGPQKEPIILHDLSPCPQRNKFLEIPVPGVLHTPSSFDAVANLIF